MALRPACRRSELPRGTWKSGEFNRPISDAARARRARGGNSLGSCRAVPVRSGASDFRRFARVLGSHSARRRCRPPARLDRLKPDFPADGSGKSELACQRAVGMHGLGEGLASARLCPPRRGTRRRRCRKFGKRRRGSSVRRRSARGCPGAVSCSGAFLNASPTSFSTTPSGDGCAR
jgi:hypothetical protein